MGWGFWATSVSQNREKATNYLDWPLLQRERENKCINEILRTDGKLSLDSLVGERGKKLPKNILYECLTQNHLLWGLAESDLRDIQLNYLTEDDRKELEKENFLSHFKTTLCSLSMGKSLGPDGCPTEFQQTFGEIIRPVTVDNYSLIYGSVPPPSTWLSIAGFLPKESKQTPALPSHL